MVVETLERLPGLGAKGALDGLGFQAPHCRPQHTSPSTAIEVMGRQRQFTVAALSDQSQFTGAYCFFSAVRSRP